MVEAIHVTALRSTAGTTLTVLRYQHVPVSMPLNTLERDSNIAVHFVRDEGPAIQ
jgi:hypothetical protein